MKISAFLACLLAASSLSAQSGVLGKWKSIDEKSGNPKSIVEITDRKGKIYGRIIRIFTKSGEDPDPVCDKCPDDDTRINQKIIGMEIIRDMVKDGEAYGDGNILDPEVGKVYTCKIWIEDNTLKVRGYIGPFYRTQTWVRVQ